VLKQENNDSKLHVATQPVTTVCAGMYYAQECIMRRNSSFEIQIALRAQGALVKNSEESCQVALTKRNSRRSRWFLVKLTQITYKRPPFGAISFADQSPTYKAAKGEDQVQKLAGKAKAFFLVSDPNGILTPLNFKVDRTSCQVVLESPPHSGCEKTQKDVLVKDNPVS
jgi:hypothetical protein